MMDHFHEEVVTKHNRTLDEILYWFSWVVLVISGFLGVTQLMGAFRVFSESGTVNGLIALAIGVVQTGVAVAIFFYQDRLRTEYEYTFTNGALDFAQVFNNKKRRSLGSLNVKTIEVCGPVSGKGFARYANMKDCKQMRWFLNRDANLHFFYFQKDSVKNLIVFEPSDELVAMIRQYLPHGAWTE